MQFDKLDFKSFRLGKQAIVEFDNGYGASVVQGPCSYGAEDGLYEMAVLHDGAICYDTPITSDVLGYLTPDEVTGYLVLVKELPKKVE